MKKQPLFNKINREVLKKDLLNETFERVTVSFYKYFEIHSPGSFRDDLYKKFDQLKIFGRVYIAKEGINAQISVPTYNWNVFKKKLGKIKELKDVPLKKALQDGKSFYKLKIKVKKSLWHIMFPKIPIICKKLESILQLSNIMKHLIILIH